MSVFSDVLRNALGMPKSHLVPTGTIRTNDGSMQPVKQPEEPLFQKVEQKRTVGRSYPFPTNKDFETSLDNAMASAEEQKAYNISPDTKYNADSSTGWCTLSQLADFMDLQEDWVLRSLIRRMIAAAALEVYHESMMETRRLPSLINFAVSRGYRFTLPGQNTIQSNNDPFAARDQSRKASGTAEDFVKAIIEKSAEKAGREWATQRLLFVGYKPTEKALQVGINRWKEATLNRLSNHLNKCNDKDEEGNPCITTQEVVINHDWIIEAGEGFNPPLDLTGIKKFRCSIIENNNFEKMGELWEPSNPEEIEDIFGDPTDV